MRGKVFARADQKRAIIFRFGGGGLHHLFPVQGRKIADFRGDDVDGRILRQRRFGRQLDTGRTISVIFTGAAALAGGGGADVTTGIGGADWLRSKSAVSAVRPRTRNRAEESASCLRNFGSRGIAMFGKRSIILRFGTSLAA